jgi:hypothetical protein
MNIKGVPEIDLNKEQRQESLSSQDLIRQVSQAHRLPDFDSADYCTGELS